MPLRLHLFGLPAIEENGLIRSLRLNNPVLLLLYLANKSDWISRSELAFLFMPDAEEAKALKMVRSIFYRIKQIDWAADYLELERRKARFNISTDTQAFKTAIAKEDWKAARKIYKAPFLADFSTADLATYNAWIDLERFDYGVLYKDVLVSYSSALEQQGSHKAAAEIIGDLLELNPLAEDYIQNYLRNSYLAGRKNIALERYQKFCEQLAQEYDSLPLPETQDLIESIKNNARLEPQQVSQQKITTQSPNLPSQASNFIGRKNDLKLLREELKNSDARLISIIGLGGMGKTRLAIELAKTSQADFADGIYFIELASLDKATELNNQVAKTLGLTLAPQKQAVEQIKTYLIDKESLLIFDNFEHILEAALILEDYLQASSRLKIIVTSRQRLSLKTESCYDLEGLNYPSENITNSLEEYDAIKLFVNSAKRVAPKMLFSDTELLDAAAITRQLEGLPLALELAASWCRIMPVQRISQELSTSYELLKSEYIGVALKHKNMKAIWEQTWQNLSQKKRETLAKFTIFKGGASLKAVEEITNTHFTVLLSLVNESLLKRIPPNRFDMHELLKQFATDKLTTSLQDTKNKHANYYWNLAFENSPQAGGKKLPTDFLQKLDDDRLNLKSSWWYLVDNKDLERSITILNPLGYLFLSKAYYKEGAEFYKKSLEKLNSQEFVGQNHSLIANLYVKSANILMPQGELEAAQEQLRRGLEVLGDEADNSQRANLLEVSARIHYYNEEFLEAKKQILHALRLLEDGDYRQKKASMWQSIGIIIVELKEYEDAEKYYYKAMESYQEIGDEYNIMVALNNIAALKMRTGELTEAKKLLEKASKISKLEGANRVTMHIFNTIASLCYKQKDYLEGESYFLDVIELCKQANDNTVSVAAFIILAKTQIKINKNLAAKKNLKEGLRLASLLDLESQYLEIILAYCQFLFADNNIEAALLYLGHVLEHDDIKEFSYQEAIELKAELNQKQLKMLNALKPSKTKDLIAEIRIKLNN